MPALFIDLYGSAAAAAAELDPRKKDATNIFI